MGHLPCHNPGMTPGCAGGGTGDGPYRVQVAISVIPDLDIISSGTLVRPLERLSSVFLAFSYDD